MGTGFTAEERARIWSIRTSVVGMLVKYKSFLVGVKDKPRHPVFLGFRDEEDV
jgi:DNA ligase-1